MFTLVLLSGIFLRFFNFSKRIIFGPEQAISLTTAAEYLRNGISLLGQPYFHHTSTGLTMFYGPQFNYMLLPFLVIFNYQPVPITVLFTLLNIFTALAIYFLTKKLTNKKIALLTFFFFMLNATMINYSLFIWGLHFFALFGFLSFYLCVRFPKLKKPLLASFFLGFISALGISFEYPYAIYALITLIVILVRSKRKWANFFSFIGGGILAGLPMILFDLRNGFYTLKVLYFYFLDQAASTTHTLDPFHFLPLWGIACFLLAYLTHKLFKGRKITYFLIIITYLFLNLSSPKVNLQSPTGMPSGVTVDTYQDVAQIISADNPKNFNIAVLLDFDTLGRPLRYLLTDIYHNVPQGYAQYQDIDALYVFAEDSYDIDKPQVWELKTYKPYKINLLKTYQSGHSLYRLEK